MNDLRGKMSADDLRKTILHDLHVELGARMVPFAGYSMPVQYDTGIIAEHRHVRRSAGLFDVSHMGQAVLTSKDGTGAVAAALESLVPGDIKGLEPGQMRYTVLTNDEGGIIDDLMITRRPDDFLVIVNAARKKVDIEHLRSQLEGVTVELADDRALIALQGRASGAVLGRHVKEAGRLGFLEGDKFTFDGIECWISRSGYTGEDGFEISVPGDAAVEIARNLIDEDEVLPAGLGARDTLRLEAGLCLYGHDIDETTTPVEAALAWTIAKRRREEADFPGADKILAQIKDGAPRKRIGLMLPGRAPAREGAPIIDSERAKIGVVTSGSFSPTLEKPIAMAYVPTELAGNGTDITLDIRGKHVTGHVTAMPFVEHRYARKEK